jgi:hypothetical protein
MKVEPCKTCIAKTRAEAKDEILGNQGKAHCSKIQTTGGNV